MWTFYTFAEIVFSLMKHQHQLLRPLLIFQCKVQKHKQRFLSRFMEKLAEHSGPCLFCHCKPLNVNVLCITFSYDRRYCIVYGSSYAYHQILHVSVNNPLKMCWITETSQTCRALGPMGPGLSNTVSGCIDFFMS